MSFVLARRTERMNPSVIREILKITEQPDVIELPADIDATALLPKAVARGMAYVPGAAFYAANAKHNTRRLSFVTVSPERIAQVVRALAETLKETA